MSFGKWKAVLYPLIVWLSYKFVAFLFGYSAWPDISQLALLSDSLPFFTSVLFGLWIGAASHKDFKLFGAMANAFIVSFIVGLSILVFTVILINTSSIFLAYSTSLYYSSTQAVGSSLMNLAVSTWLGDLFLVVPAAAFSYIIIDEVRRKK